MRLFIMSPWAFAVQKYTVSTFTCRLYLYTSLSHGGTMVGNSGGVMSYSTEKAR